MKNRKLKMYCMYLPAVTILIFFVVVPLCSTFYTSLCEWNGYSPLGSPGARKFVGLKNYIEILSLSDKRFNRAFINTLYYGFASAILQNIFGLLVAIFVNSKFRGNNIVRTVVYLPEMISGLVMGYIMTFMVDFDRGVLNEILGWIGIDKINWLGDGTCSMILVVLICTWQHLGSCMIIYLAGLQSVSVTYSEAAKIDGAGNFQIFRYVTLPQLVPAIMTSTVLNMIGNLKIFDLIVSFTGGGPNYKTHSLTSYLNLQYFTKERAGYAAAVGMVTFVFIMVVSLILNKYFRSKMIEE